MSDLAPDALLFLCDDLCSLTLVLSLWWALCVPYC
jgi:hypothetical protein